MLIWFLNCYNTLSLGIFCNYESCTRSSIKLQKVFLCFFIRSVGNLGDIVARLLYIGRHFLSNAENVVIQSYCRKVPFIHFCFLIDLWN